MSLLCHHESNRIRLEWSNSWILTVLLAAAINRQRSSCCHWVLKFFNGLLINGKVLIKREINYISRVLMSLLLWVHKVYQEFPNGRVVQGIYSMYEWTSGVILPCPPRYLIYISWKLINWDMMRPHWDRLCTIYLWTDHWLINTSNPSFKNHSSALPLSSLSPKRTRIGFPKINRLVLIY